MNRPDQPVNPPPVPEVSEDLATELAEMFRLMGDPSRLRIILACLETPTSVGDIAIHLGLSNSLVSHHLRLLRAARILRGQRRGKQIYYSAADQHVSRVIADMLEHVAEPDSHDEE
ncbi:MAG: winged helix-turn-helix transcriptional regulator [Gammaproteobacteria bacterium]|nr:winged helix-turn-helix transcriptional regulator [Gammaproteobacteria bacterium]